MHFCTVGWFFWNLIYENLVSVPFFNSKFLTLIKILKLTALLLFSHSPCSSAHGIAPTRILEWLAISFSRRSSQPRDQARISCIGRQMLYHWTTLEALLIHTECFNLDYIVMLTAQKLLFFFHVFFLLMYFTYYSLGWFKSIVSLRSFRCIYILKLLGKKLSISGKDTPCPPPISVHILIYRCRLQVISSVQSLGHVWLFAAPQTTARQASLSITNCQSLPKPMSIESVMPSNHLMLCRPLLLLPSIFPSIRAFQMSQLFESGGQSIGVSASTSVLPMNTQVWSPLGWREVEKGKDIPN